MKHTPGWACPGSSADDMLYSNWMIQQTKGLLTSWWCGLRLTRATDSRRMMFPADRRRWARQSYSLSRFFLAHRVLLRSVSSCHQRHHC